MLTQLDTWDYQLTADKELVSHNFLLKSYEAYPPVEDQMFYSQLYLTLLTIGFYNFPDLVW